MNKMYYNPLKAHFITLVYVFKKYSRKYIMKKKASWLREAHWYLARHLDF